jgi:serine/threonine protein phosphatase 1
MGLFATLQDWRAADLIKGPAAMPSRTLAIGDIHGCLTPFDALIESLAPTRDDHLILLGDIIDRGPDSAGVLRRVLSLRQTLRLTMLMGNHEQMMLDARNSHAKLADWRLNGGDATLRSYGGVRGALRHVPKDHWEFLERSLANYVQTDTHIFVHASAHPDHAMDEQPDYILRWERCENTPPHESGKVIVCGHTPQLDRAPLNRGHLICIDTHAHGGGPLTCLHAESGRVWQASPNGRVVKSHISDYDSTA